MKRNRARRRSGVGISGADVVAREDLRQHVGLGAVGDDHRGALGRRQPRRLELAQHAAGTATRGAAGRMQVRRDRRTASSGMRVAVGSTLGLAVKSPSTLVSSTSRSASSATATRAARPSLSPNTRKGVSLALLALVLDQLPDADAVVFVEHRHRAQLEQAHQRRAHAQGAVAVAEILLGQEHLRRDQALLGKGLRIGGHELALAHRRARLPQAERARPLPQAQTAASPCRRHPR